jgi:hypothetical protein
MKPLVDNELTADKKPATRRAGRSSSQSNVMNFFDTFSTVSVSLISYNHELYIRECLDNMFVQKTDFPYEICIEEDGSSDGTHEICVEPNFKLRISPMSRI